MGRRKKASALLGDRILVVSSAKFKTKYTNSYPLDEDSNFYYLTGLLNCEAILVLTNKGDSFLFLEEPTKEEKVWEHFVSLEEAKKLNFTNVYPLKEFSKEIKSSLTKVTGLVINLQEEKLLKSFNNFNLDVLHINNLVGKLRLIKDDIEIENIKHAINVTKMGLDLVKENLLKFKNEKEIEHLLDATYLKNGCFRSFVPIVASGNNANTLHYSFNNQKIKNQILIDTGVKYQGYASDITRTYLLNPNKFQENIYQLVKLAQEKAIETIKPGITLEDVHETVIKVLVNGLIKLKILKGSPSKIIKDKSYRTVYPHSTSHFLGLDTHDVKPLVNKKIVLQKGMVITIEPGLYFNQQNRDLPKDYRGIGVRIEDDILVTRDGACNLSSEIEK